MVNNIEIGKLECEGGAHAEGSARAELTLVAPWQDDAECSAQGAGIVNPGETYWLIQKVNGQSLVNTVTVLAGNSYPRGGQSIYNQN